MSKVLVDLKRIEEIKRLDSIGRGKEGSCYLAPHEIIKIYHMLDNKRKIYFDDLNSENISFPKDIYIYENINLIAGYTMDYLSGGKILNGFKCDLEIDKLKQMYIDIRNTIINYKDIYMDDLCLENILLDYKNNKINLIDTSKWYPKDNSSEKNIMWLDRCLVYVLLSKNLEWLIEYANKSNELFNLYRFYKLGYHINFLEILDAIKYDVEQKSNCKVKTINDLIIKI